ncbi:MAG: preprotein translocase subunit SecG [Pseudomonadota bacterium]
MQNVILVVHILACIALTAVVLLQRSEGGALGIGGGGPGGGLMSGRGAAGALVRTTMIFAAVFFVTSLTLTTLAARTDDSLSDAERAAGATIDPEGDSIIDERVLDPDIDLLPSEPVETPLDLDGPGPSAAPDGSPAELGETELSLDPPPSAEPEDDTAGDGAPQ